MIPKRAIAAVLIAEIERLRERDDMMRAHAENLGAEIERAIATMTLNMDQLRREIERLRQHVETLQAKFGFTCACGIDFATDVCQVRGGTMSTIDIVFDGPPGPESGRFIEVEDESGRSIKFGDWLQRPDGYWVLRIELEAQP